MLVGSIGFYDSIHLLKLTIAHKRALELKVKAKIQCRLLREMANSNVQAWKVSKIDMGTNEMTSCILYMRRRLKRAVIVHTTELDKEFELIIARVTV